MNDLLFEVLMNLFHQYMSDHPLALPPLKLLIEELEKLSNVEDPIQPQLTKRKTTLRRYIASPSPDAVRIFSADETEKLNYECQILLHHLVSNGYLTTKQRELMINEVMTANIDSISVEQLKTAILLMLERLTLKTKEIALLVHFIPDTPHHSVH